MFIQSKEEVPKKYKEEVPKKSEGMMPIEFGRQYSSYTTFVGEWSSSLPELALW